MLNVRFVTEHCFQLVRNSIYRNIFGHGLAPVVLSSWGMRHNERLNKLREKQHQLAATIREAEAIADTQLRKRELRAKLILGGALLGLPPGERETLLSILLSLMTERDRNFVTEFLDDEQMSTKLEDTDPNHQGLN